MNFDKLVELELARHDWPNIRALNGAAADTPIAFRLLLASQNEKEVEAAYWMLENYVVVQGRLSEAALHCVPVICAALVASTRSNLIRGWLLELLFQIVHGFTSPQDKAGGLAGLEYRCQEEARKATWILYRELALGEHQLAALILRVLETPSARSDFIIEKLRLKKNSSGRWFDIEPPAQWAVECHRWLIILNEKGVLTDTELRAALARLPSGGHQ